MGGNTAVPSACKLSKDFCVPIATDTDEVEEMLLMHRQLCTSRTCRLHPSSVSA